MIRGGERGGRPPYPDRDRGADLILKRLAGSIAFSTSRSNTKLPDRMGYQFLCVDGLGRHSAPQGGVGVFEAALGFKPRRAVKGHKSSFMAYRPCGQIIDATLVLTPKQHFTTEEKDIVEQGATPSDRSPTRRRQRGPGRLLVDKRYNLIRRLETVMPPPHDRPALRRRTGPDEHERGGLCWYGLCSPRTRESEAGYRDRLQRKATRAPQRN
jgi:transposase, IS5 family